MKIQDIKNSKVLVRVCYDISDFAELDRIQDSIETIKTLLSNQNKVMLITHWGRPQGHDEERSTQKLIKPLTQVLKENGWDTRPKFLDQYKGFDEVRNTLEESDDNLFLLENTRFEAAEKSKNDSDRDDLAAKYASLAEYYIDEAFAVSHRQEVTNFELKQKLPNTLGISHEKELEVLTKLRDNPQKPFVAIMAGAKLETKLPLIRKMLPHVDKLILGGMLAFTFVQVAKDLGMEKYKNIDLAESKIDQSFYDIAMELLKYEGQKIVLPIDFEYGNIFGVREIFDVGEESLELFKKALDGAETIFWNGTLGYYEQKPFDKGTMELAEYVAGLPAYTVIGGGDTNTAIPASITSKFDFVSMGGGATLDFLGQG